MRTISRRLQKLECLPAFQVEREDKWGHLATVRDQIIGNAELAYGRGGGSDVSRELDELGPAGLLRETARVFLADHGFVQAAEESFAETMARALDIGTDQLRVLIAQGQIGSVLLEKFGVDDGACNVR